MHIVSVHDMDLCCVDMHSLGEHFFFGGGEGKQRMNFVFLVLQFRWEKKNSLNLDTSTDRFRRVYYPNEYVTTAKMAR